MNGINEVRLLGNLTADPELRFTQSGQPVLNFRMATNEKYKNKEGEFVEKVEYHGCVLWGKRGEALAKFLTKGSPIHVSGALRTSSWEDKDNGQKRYKTEVNVNDVILLGGKRDGGASDDASPPAGGSGDDIPF